MLPSREVGFFTALVTKRAAQALPLAASAQLRLRRVASRMLLALPVLLALGNAQGQSTVFMGALVQPYSGSGALPGVYQGAARDLQGNLWVSTQFGTGLTEVQAVNGVLPVPPASPNPVTVASGKFSNPVGLAVDSAGDLWVADAGANAILELVAVSGVIPSNPTVTTIISTGLNRPWALAFDASGNLWFADRGNSAIKEALAVSGTVPANPTVNVVSNSFELPEGVAVDAHGNVFVADPDGNGIVEMPGVAPPAASTPPSTPTLKTIATGFTFPQSVAVDSQGNVWVADNQSGYFDEVVAVSGSIPANPVVIPFATWPTSPSEQEPAAISIDGQGDIFLVENLGSIQGIVSELTPTGIFGQVQAGTGSSTSPLPTVGNRTLLFGFTASTTVNAPTVVTQGITGLDFTDLKSGTCTADGTSHSWLAGTYCTVAAKFVPLYPGTRLGAVILSSGSKVLNTVPLSGDGVAPMINFGFIQSGFYRPTSRPQVAASTSFQNPENIAVDPNHNIYIVDRNGCCIYEATAASNYQTVTTPVTTSNYPLTINIDGAGDLIWDDRGSGQILEAVATNGVLGSSPPIVTLLGSLSNLSSTLIDSQGDVFFSDQGFNGIRELVAVNGQIPANPTIRPIENTILTGAMAFDQYGNLYLTTGNPGCLYEISPVGGQIPANSTPQQIICGLGIPGGLAVDAAGNIWESDFYNGLVEIQATNGTVTALSTMHTWSSGSGFGLGLDENGSVFTSLYPEVLQFDFSDPPSFTWSGQTNTGDTSPTTYTAFATDAGNAPITLPVPASGTNPSINPNWTWATTATGACPGVSADASSAVTIGLNTICDLTISFSPITGGPLTGQLTFDDDSLYIANNTQSITLTGDAIGLSAPTISWTPATPIAFGTALGSADFAATAISGGSNVSADGTFTYYVGSVGGTAATASTLLPGGSNTLCVQWTPSSEYSSVYGSASECLAITVNAASTSIQWTPASPIGSGQTLASGQFNASALAGSNTVSSDGTFVYYVGSVGGTVATTSTVLPIGSNQLCVQWTPSSSYTADYHSSQTCTTVQVNAGPTINWTPTTPITYGATLGSGQFNASTFSGATNISADGTFTYYLGSVGGTVATPSTLLPGGSNTLCVQWVPSSSYSSQYSSASQCLPITVNAESTSSSWSPSSTSIIASAGPTAAQLDAAALAGSTNVTADGTMTYHLSTAGGTPISIGATLSLGPVTICAVWAPTSGYSLDFSSSSTCKTFTVINTQPTTTLLASNANPVFSTYSVTFTATVTPTSGSTVPTGKVTFYDNGTSIGTGSLSPSGEGASAIATLTTSSLAIGTNPITASYPGDTSNQASQTNAALPEVVEDFSVTANAPLTITMEPGTTATFNFTVSPVSPATTFPAAITLTAANLPTGATASFSPASLTSGAGSTNVTLTVTTPITTLARNLPPPGRAPDKWPLIALALLFMPAARKFRRARRRLTRLLSLLLLATAGITAVAALNGCGGVPSGYFGQAPATSAITVTGTSGSLNHSASVSLTVE